MPKPDIQPVAGAVLAPGAASVGDAHTVAAACHRLGRIGRSTIYRLIADGRLKAVKLGRRTLITEASIAALLASLPQLQGGVGRRERGGR